MDLTESRSIENNTKTNEHKSKEESPLTADLDNKEVYIIYLSKVLGYVYPDFNISKLAAFGSRGKIIQSKSSRSSCSLVF